MNKLTATRLRELLKYDPDTGIFTSIIFRVNRRGGIAGRSRKDGYVDIGVDGNRYLAHRLAWLYMTDKWPEAEIDHKNGLLNDNRFDNLREATRSINSQNIRKARKDNKLGMLGVSQRGEKFAAQIEVFGENIYLGLFATPEQAHLAYLNEKRKLHEGNTL